MAKTTIDAKKFPHDVHILGGGNVGIITAYHLTEFYRTHEQDIIRECGGEAGARERFGIKDNDPLTGRLLPHIHIWDKNKGPAQSISAQIGAHLQADETQNEAEKGLPIKNMYLTFSQGGRRLGTGNSTEEITEWLRSFSDQGLECLLMAARADEKFTEDQFNDRIAEQTRLGTASMQLWETMMAKLDSPNAIPDFAKRCNYNFGRVTDGGGIVQPDGSLNGPEDCLRNARGILKFEVDMTPEYVKQVIGVFNRGLLGTIAVKLEQLLGLSRGDHGLAENTVHPELVPRIRSGCLLQDGGSIQSEKFSELLLKYMQENKKLFNVEFHGGVEIAGMKFLKQNDVSRQKKAGDIDYLIRKDGTQIQGDSFIFATGNMIDLFEREGVRTGVPMMGICGVTQNIDPGPEYWRTHPFPKAAIKSVTPGSDGGVVKCVITPMVERGEDGQERKYIRIGGQFCLRDPRDLKGLGHIAKMDPPLSGELLGFANEALGREQAVMDQLWPDIMKAARSNLKGKSEAEGFSQWIQGRPASPDHCGEVGHMVRNKTPVANAYCIMGRGSGGTSFAPIDAEILAQEMCLGRAPKDVKIMDAAGVEINRIGEASDPMRFSDPRHPAFNHFQVKGNPFFFDRGGPIAGSITPKEQDAGANKIDRDRIIAALVPMIEKAKPGPEVREADVNAAQAPSVGQAHGKGRTGT